MPTVDPAGQRYVAFPPRWHTALVPVSPAGACAMGMTLYTASRTVPLVAQRMLWALARVGRIAFGPGGS